jgi:hypothetical protein
VNTYKQYYHWIIALVAFIAICAACYFCFKPQQKGEPEVVSTVKKEAKIITVFIHGSLLPDNTFIETISLSDLNMILFDTIDDDSEYMKSLKRVRSNPDTYGDQIMLAEGLQEIGDTHLAQLCDIQDNKVIQIQEHHCSCCHHAEHVLIKKSPAEKSDPKGTFGAHYAIACYSSFMKRLFPKYDTSYYTFGHLGVLSHRYRENVAKELYHALLAAVKEAQDVYETVKLVLVTHSHGGSIALNLAVAENEFKKGLVIDHVVLLGTPLQAETAPHAYHPMFKRVLNCYSLGDKVQGSDILTTASRKCYKTFSSIESPVARKEGTVYDIQLVVNDDGHAVNHGNMWNIKQGAKGASYLDPLPYAVLAPALIAALEAHPFGSSVQASIRAIDDHISVEMKDIQKDDLQYRSPNAYDIVATMRDRTASHLTRQHA